MATILEHSKIAPPPESPPEFSLPFTFFDMTWYSLPATQCLLFYYFPGSKSHFLDTIVPDLKTSLSLTLAHFLPLAGNIIHPLNPHENKPIIRYESGDSLSFIVSESDADFSRLTGNRPQSCDDLHDCAPDLPPVKRSENSNICPVLALQVTLFPGQGLCIGVASHHGVVDASTLRAFFQSWAMINCSRISDGIKDNYISIVDKLIERNILPSYDRKALINLNGLDSIYWDLIVKYSFQGEQPPAQFPINKLRATFVLKKHEIQKLKNLVFAKSPVLAYLSSFTIGCALIWVCSAKSAARSGEVVADDEPEYFYFPAHCRGRMNPPLPASYFGNCFTQFKAELKHGDLKRPDGFVKAAAAIGEAIKENMYSGNEILDVIEKWPAEIDKLDGKRQHWVAGSPRFDFYTADFGWGKPNKFEILSTEVGWSGATTVSVSKSRHFEGGLEIGLSKTAVEMNAFATVFNEVLGNLSGEIAFLVPRL